MAEFCKQCINRLYPENKSEGSFVGMGGEQKLTEDQLKKHIGWRVLCEGCGPTVVDDEGNCISHICPLHGGTPLKDPNPSDIKVYQKVIEDMTFFQQVVTMGLVEETITQKDLESMSAHYVTIEDAIKKLKEHGYKITFQGKNW